jgi:hypothetical protein
MNSGSSVNTVVLEILHEVVDASLCLTEDDDPGSIEVLLQDFEKSELSISMLFLLIIFAVVITEIKVLGDPCVSLQVLISNLDIDWHHAAE